MTVIRDSEYRRLRIIRKRERLLSLIPVEILRGWIPNDRRPWHWDRAHVVAFIAGEQWDFDTIQSVRAWYEHAISQASATIPAEKG